MIVISNKTIAIFALFVAALILSNQAFAQPPQAQEQEQGAQGQVEQHGQRHGQQGRKGAGQGRSERGQGGGRQGRGRGKAGQRGRKGGGGPRNRVRPRDTAFNAKFPIGTQLSDNLKLYDADRNLVLATSILKSKYTVVVAGCLTCPAYRSSYPEIEAVARDFSDQGVNFYFLYQTLAHPENWGFVQPTSIEERFAQVEHAKELLQTKIPWLTDTIDNQMKEYLVSTPNSQLVFDESGKVVHRDSWGRGSSLRESLESLVGKPEKTTSVADLSLPKFKRHLTSESDMLIKRLKVDGVAVPLKVEAAGDSGELDSFMSKDFVELNRYAKLRCEADQQLIKTGTGKLYLGFRQDPVLGAKWNNLSTPPEYKIVSEGATFTPASGQSPKMKVESDSEPREFLVDVKDWKADQPIVVQIQYFACNNEEGWCNSVQQEFTIRLRRREAPWSWTKRWRPTTKQLDRWHRSLTAHDTVVRHTGRANE